MDFRDIEIKREQNIVKIEYENESIILYKSTFQKDRTCYLFAQENASNDFIKYIFNNINLIGIEMDEKSKKYFIDADD